MMLIEQCTVSRKTPNDGMLEISSAAAARFDALGADFRLATDGAEGTGRVRSMSCTCAKGAGTGHRHYFIEAELLRALVPGTEVRIALDDARPDLVRIEPA